MADNPFGLDFKPDTTDAAPVTGAPAAPAMPPDNPFGLEFRTTAPGAPPPPQHNKITGEMRAHNREDQPFTERLRGDLQDTLIMWGVEPFRARHMGDAIGNLLGMTPAGPVMSAADLAHSAPNIDTSSLNRFGRTGITAAIDAAGALPVISQARRVLHGAPQVVPAFEAPFRETRRTEPPIGGFVTPIPSEARTAAKEGYTALEQAPLVYHPDAMRSMIDRARVALPDATIGGAAHTPESAKGVFDTLDRYYGRFPGAQTAPPPAPMSALTGVGANPAAPAARPVHAYDFDQLRKELSAVSKQDPTQGAAVRQATEILNGSMLYPQPGMILQGQNLLPQLRVGYADTRGNYRGYKTSTAVDDAMTAARIRDTDPAKSFNQFIATPQGRNKIFGATPGQLDRLEGLSTGDATTRTINAAGDLLGGHSTAGRIMAPIASGAIGGTLAALAGHSGPVITAASLAAPALTSSAGATLHAIANARTRRQGEQLSADIMRETPLYRANAALPQNAPIDDPRAAARDTIVRALMSPAMREGQKNWVEDVYTPYPQRR